MPCFNKLFIRGSGFISVSFDDTNISENMATGDHS